MSLELFGVNRSSRNRVEVFNANGGSFSSWIRRPEESMAFMLLIGAGSGGGGGMTGATATVRGGGGGGGSGAIARCLLPLFSLPQQLFVQVGVGGAGGAATVAGSQGTRSWITVAPNTTAANVVMVSGAANSGTTAAAAGSTGGSAAAGTAETISTVTLCILANFGISNFIAGKIGAIGGVVGGGAGSANTILTASQMNGGGGGGTTPAANTEFAGGAQTGAGIYPTISGGPGTSGGNASGGYSFLNGILIPYGGAGGGTGGAGTAGRGGDGGIGAGGGGGGGGITGGAGGRGGDGLVVIISW